MYRQTAGPAQAAVRWQGWEVEALEDSWVTSVPHCAVVSHWRIAGMGLCAGNKASAIVIGTVRSNCCRKQNISRKAAV